MTEASHIALLLFKEREGTLSGEEQTQLTTWISENPGHTKFFDEVTDQDQLTEMIRRHHPENKEEVRKDILSRIIIDFKVVPLYRRPFFRIAAAACIALLITVGGYFMFFNKKQDGEQPPVAKTTDVEPPKSDKAVIRFDNGKEIAVDTLTSYTDGNITVTKMPDGRLVYSGLGTEVKFNTLTNPRGSTVRDITLPDGTQIWLNAESSITYPVAFAGNERKVSMTGEAFFKVSHNPSMPFTLSKGEVNVTVLGTEFNVNAYEDEVDMKVTLVEGSVKVSKASSTKIIKPGQQAQVGSDVRVVDGVNMEEVLAWKNGLFQFTRADIKTIMRQIARWYDVDVEYRDNITDHFKVKFSRNENMSMVFKKLQETQAVKFEIQGKKLIVSL